MSYYYCITDLTWPLHSHIKCFCQIEGYCVNRFMLVNMEDGCQLIEDGEWIL